MEARNILDLKVYAYMLLNIHFFQQREEKSALENKLKLVLKELVKIKAELSQLGLGNHQSINASSENSQDNELYDLIQKIQIRINSLPKESIGEGLSNEQEEVYA